MGERGESECELIARWGLNRGGAWDTTASTGGLMIREEVEIQLGRMFYTRMSANKVHMRSNSQEK